MFSQPCYGSFAIDAVGVGIFDHHLARYGSQDGFGSFDRGRIGRLTKPLGRASQHGVAGLGVQVAASLKHLQGILFRQPAHHRQHGRIADQVGHLLVVGKQLLQALFRFVVRNDRLPGTRRLISKPERSRLVHASDFFPA